jgi:putative transcriptional regulator
MGKKTNKEMSVFDQIKAGLEDSVAFSKGRLSLATTELPAPPPNATKEQIAGIRNKLGMSQTVFASVLNVSVKTVQSWEQGLREPSDAALRLLQLVGDNAEVAWKIMAAPRVLIGPHK